MAFTAHCFPPSTALLGLPQARVGDSQGGVLGPPSHSKLLFSLGSWAVASMPTQECPQVQAALGGGTVLTGAGLPRLGPVQTGPSAAPLTIRLVIASGSPPHPAVRLCRCYWGESSGWLDQGAVRLQAKADKR